MGVSFSLYVKKSQHISYKFLKCIIYSCLCFFWDDVSLTIRVVRFMSPKNGVFVNQKPRKSKTIKRIVPWNC